MDKLFIPTDRVGLESCQKSIGNTFCAVNALLLALTTPGRKERKNERQARVLKKAKGMKLAQAVVLSLIILAFIIPPIASIAVRAFYTKDGIFSLSAWERIAGRGFGLIGGSVNAAINSLAIGLVTAFLSVWMGSAIATASAKRNSKLLPFITSLPMATGSVMMGLGFIFVTSFIFTSLGIRSYCLSLLSVIAAHLVIVLPFSVRTITPGARTIPALLPDAAYTLGASKRRTRRKVEMPFLYPYMRKAFAFSFALSLGEVNATLTLSDGRISTIPVLIYRMIGSYNYQGAAALGTILLAEALIIFAIGECGGKKNGIS